MHLKIVCIKNSPLCLCLGSVRNHLSHKHSCGIFNPFVCFQTLDTSNFAMQGLVGKKLCNARIIWCIENSKIHTRTLSHSAHPLKSFKMHAMWVSLKENVKCGSKLADVVGRRERCNRRFNNSGKAYFDGGELVFAHGKETPIRDLVYRVGYTQAQLSGKCLAISFL